LAQRPMEGPRRRPALGDLAPFGTGPAVAVSAPRGRRGRGPGKGSPSDPANGAPLSSCPGHLHPADGSGGPAWSAFRPEPERRTVHDGSDGPSGRLTRPTIGTILTLHCFLLLASPGGRAGWATREGVPGTPRLPLSATRGAAAAAPNIPLVGPRRPAVQPTRVSAPRATPADDRGERTSACPLSRAGKDSSRRGGHGAPGPRRRGRRRARRGAGA
jgi:hypothetical protein